MLCIMFNLLSNVLSGKREINPFSEQNKLMVAMVTHVLLILFVNKTGKYFTCSLIFQGHIFVY